MRLFAGVSVLVLIAVGMPAWAADDGQTQPRYNKAFLSLPSTSTDIIATTNGAGNVKGVHCQFGADRPITIKFYINGGAAQSVEFGDNEFPVDENLVAHSGWIPYNIRFTTSIRVQMVRGSGGIGEIICGVSWALD